MEPHTIDLSAPVEQRRLAPLPPLPNGRRFMPVTLAPNGRWLAGHSRSASGTLEPTPVFLFDVEKKAYEVLLDSDATPRGWLPDFRRLLICRQEGPCELLDRVTRKVSPAGTLGEHAFWFTPPWLSRDGRSLFGSRGGEAQGEIWMLDRDAPR